MSAAQRRDVISTNFHLVWFLSETLNAVDIDAAIIHDGHHMAAIRADCHGGDGVIVGA